MNECMHDAQPSGVFQSPFKNQAHTEKKNPGFT